MGGKHVIFLVRNNKFLFLHSLSYINNFSRYHVLLEILSQLFKQNDDDSKLSLS